MGVFSDVSDNDVKDTPAIEFVNLELNHFRTVTKDNVFKDPMILPPGSNYNRSDRLAIDASLGSRPTALSKEDFVKLGLHPVWTLSWDGEDVLQVKWSKTHEHHIDITELGNSPLKIANQGLYERSHGHVIVVTTEPGGDENQHRVVIVASEGEDKNGETIVSNRITYTVMGA